MIEFKKLVLSGTVAGLMLGSGAASAHVSYNTNGAPNNPDGSSAGPWTAGNPGYSGSLPATWAAEVHNAGGVANSQTASSAGAGFLVGMGAKSYKDGTTNWAHSADFGLFELQADAIVTITVSSEDAGLRPAFGLWSGWDTSTSASRHSAYTSNGAINPMAAGILDSTLDLVDANAWAFAGSAGVGASATLTRVLTAGTYTLILGGYDSGITAGNLPYSATISAAPVPVPAAVWLFGSALAGMGVIGRRRKSEG